LLLTFAAMLSCSQFATDEDATSVPESPVTGVPSIVAPESDLDAAPGAPGLGEFFNLWLNSETIPSLP